MNAVDARSFRADCRVIAGSTSGWAYKGSAVVMKIAICAGSESPEIVDAIDAVIGGLERIGKMASERRTRSSSEGCPSMGRKSA